VVGETDLAGNVHVLRLRLDALELDAFADLAPIAFDAVEMFEEIVVPEGAAELAVGGVLEADRFLLADDLEDFLVLDLAQAFGGKRAGFAFLAGVLQAGCAEQAADMVGAEGGFAA
jgi:hypothetical protein